MRYAAILAALLAAAGPARATECRLSTQDCMTVYQELTMIEVARDRDRASLSNLAPYPREMAVIERAHKRLVSRAKVLPIPIGNELARIVLCEVEDKSAALDGRSNTDKRCR